jgi:hypothetical protein
LPLSVKVCNNLSSHYTCPTIHTHTPSLRLHPKGVRALRSKASIDVFFFANILSPRCSTLPLAFNVHRQGSCPQNSLLNHTINHIPPPVLFRHKNHSQSTSTSYRGTTLGLPETTMSENELENLCHEQMQKTKSVLQLYTESRADQKNTRKKLAEEKSGHERTKSALKESQQNLEQLTKKVSAQVTSINNLFDFRHREFMFCIFPSVISYSHY